MADERRKGSEDAAERPGEDASEEVLTLVCLKCGTEYYFTDEAPPKGISCAKCGNTVFREYLSPREGDEAAEDFEEVTGRDLDADDAEGDTLPGDVLDLNRD